MDPPATKLLRIETPHFVAGAFWQRNGVGAWECVEAAPIIRYLVGMSAAEAKTYLDRKGWRYQWLGD